MDIVLNSPTYTNIPLVIHAWDIQLAIDEFNNPNIGYDCHAGSAWLRTIRALMLAGF